MILCPHLKLACSFDTTTQNGCITVAKKLPTWRVHHHTVSLFRKWLFPPFSDSSDLILQLSSICCRAHIGSVSFSLPAGRCSVRTSNDVLCLSLQVLMKISLFPSAMGPPLSCSLPNKPLVCVNGHRTEITGNESTSLKKGFF